MPPSANIILKNIQSPGSDTKLTNPQEDTIVPVVNKKDKPLKIATGRKFR